MEKVEADKAANAQAQSAAAPAEEAETEEALISSRRQRLHLMTLRSCVPGGRDYRLRSCEEIQEAALLTGEDRQSGAPDCFRHQKALFTGRNG